MAKSGWYSSLSGLPRLRRYISYIVDKGKMTLEFLYKRKAAALLAQGQTSKPDKRNESLMKRFILVGILFGLTACKHDSVKPTCYDCELIAASGSSGAITKQTRTFCTETEKDQFFNDHKNDPSTQYLACKNQ